MTSRGKTPDAWDDEWENQVDKTKSISNEPEAKLSKAERRARQAELNRRLWEEAEAPKTNFFVESRDKVPLQSEFKPTMKVLSRKPAPNIIAKKDALTGIDKLTIEDDDDDEDLNTKQKPMTMEERQIKAAKEREEKQRKYEEVRERLFGSSNPGSGSNTPGNTTPPPQASSSSSSRARGKGRGSRDSRPSSASSAKTKQLYDPNYSAKPDSMYLQKQNNAGTDASTPADEDVIIRQPKGPDGSGRGGFGFSSRDRIR